MLSKDLKQLYTVHVYKGWRL